MKVKYAGPLLDYSGYGEANRHDVGALVSVGVQVTTQIPKYTLELADFGHLGELARNSENKPLGYKIKILHTTPNVYRQFMEPGIYHIGRVFWETDRLPLDFAANCELMDEIWTGSEYNARAIRNAGVTKPIHIIPEAIDTKFELNDYPPYITECKDLYTFYSIFEWTERKNPGTLLEAYFTEFENTEGVGLVIKTYVDNFTVEKKNEIDQHIRLIKKRLNLKRYPPLFLFRRLMDRRQVYRFHRSYKCFISTHRGEGWGIPQMEAMLLGNPVISTGAGGIHEYLEHKKSAYILPYSMIPLVENSRNRQWYQKGQNWADVSTQVTREAMRWVFDHKQEVQSIAEEGRKTVEERFSLPAVGQMMMSRLREITKSFEPVIT